MNTCFHFLLSGNPVLFDTNLAEGQAPVKPVFLGPLVYPFSPNHANLILAEDSSAVTPVFFQLPVYFSPKYTNLVSTLIWIDSFFYLFFRMRKKSFL
jgi:hypothetical protein